MGRGMRTRTHFSVKYIFLRTFLFLRYFPIKCCKVCSPIGANKMPSPSVVLSKQNDTQQPATPDTPRQGTLRHTTQGITQKERLTKGCELI